MRSSGQVKRTTTSVILNRSILNLMTAMTRLIFLTALRHSKTVSIIWLCCLRLAMHKTIKWKSASTRSSEEPIKIGTTLTQPKTSLQQNKMISNTFEAAPSLRSPRWPLTNWFQGCNTNSKWELHALM